MGFETARVGGTHDGRVEVVGIQRESIEDALENDRCGVCGSIDHFREDCPRKLREGDQQLPVANEELDIQSQVIADIEERRKVGIERYGSALQPFNGRDAVRDLYEELLDACMYAKQWLLERERLLSAAEENQRLKLRVAHLEAESTALNDELADWRTDA